MPVEPQAQGGAQAVRPVARHSAVQMPPRTTQAAPSPNSGSQSVSLRQTRQCPAGPPLKAAQKPAFPVVRVQKQLGLLGLHGTSTPAVQESVSAMQTPALCARPVFFPFFPSPRPEQDWPAFLQKFPTLTQARALRVIFFFFLRLLCFFLPSDRPGIAIAPNPSAPATLRREKRSEKVRVKRSK